MSRVSLKLDVGDGRLRSLRSSLSRLNRQLDRVYQKGQDNNGSISDKDLTNLQRHLSKAQSGIANKKSEVTGKIDEARLVGNTRLANAYLKQVKKLVEAENTINQLFYSSQDTRYQAVNQYRVRRSKGFESNKYTQSNFNFDFEFKELKHKLGRYSNRSKIISNRWDTVRHNGVITADQYDKFKGTNDYLTNTFGKVSVRFNSFQNRFNQELGVLRNQRSAINSKIVDGDNSEENIRKRSGLDEQIFNLENKYASALSDMEFEVDSTRDRLAKNRTKIDNVNTKSSHKSSNSAVTVIPSQDSLRGYWEHHKRGMIRSGVIAGIANLAGTYHRGNNIILNDFDNVKATSYATGHRDTAIEGELAKAGYPIGMNIDEMSKYLNAYTASTGNADLTKANLSKITGSWAGLARYSGANNSTTQNLEYIAGLTALSSDPKQFARLANQIQNALTNSKMSAKATEQEQALAGMYQTAYNVGGPLTHQEQRNLAGFQAAMADTHDSSMQGENGLRAYQGMASAFGANNVNARMLFGAGDASTFTPHGQAVLTEKMQKATSNPYYYKTPIKNLLANAATQTKSKRGQQRIAAMNLVKLSKENGGDLTPDQAEKLVKMEQEHKFDKKHIDKLTKGNGKGYKNQYNKSGTANLQKYRASMDKSAKETASALNHLTRHLYWFVSSPIIGGLVSGISSSLVGDAVGALAYLPWGKYKKTIMRSHHLGSSKAVKDITGSNLEDHANNKSADVKSHIHNFKTNVFTKGKSKLGRFKGAGTKSKQFLKLINSSKRGKTLGLVAGAGILGYGLLNSGDNADASTKSGKQSNPDHDSIHNSSHDSSRKSSHDSSYKSKVATSDISALSAKLNHNYKHLHKEEWKLIRHLNTYWDVFLRKAKEAGSSDSDSDTGGDANDTAKSPEEWKDDIKKAAKEMGQKVSDEQANMIVSMIAGESNGDPTITQKVWDQNMAAGTPAQGLLQFVPSTFNHYAVPGHTNIKSGYDQLLALFNDSTWSSDIHYGGGWTPHGNPIKKATGGIVTHSTGNAYQGKLVATTISKIKNNSILGNTDIHSIYMMSRIKEPRNYIKPVRNQPKFNIKIDVSQARKFDRSTLVSQVISDTFNEWLNAKKQAKLVSYYSNEITGQFV